MTMNPSTTSTSMADEVEAMVADVRTTMPSEAVEVFLADQARLAADGAPAEIARPGTAIPDVALTDVEGRSTTIAQARNGTAAVLVFYRGTWCPYCNVALRIYERDLAPALRERDVTLIAISPQKPDGSLTTREVNELSYSVLSDTDNDLAQRLGILSTTSPEAVGAQAQIGLDLANHNADGTRNVPLPTVVIVDTDNTIRWIDVHANYAERTEVGDILAALDALSA